MNTKFMYKVTVKISFQLGVCKRKAGNQQRTYVTCPECNKEFSSQYVKKHLAYHGWPEKTIIEFCGAIYKGRSKSGAQQCPACSKIVSHYTFQ